MSRTSGSYLRQVNKLLRRSKAPKIIETSPAGEEENHEKYSPPLSAALGADHRVNFKDLADHLGPALGADGPVGDSAFPFIQGEALQGQQRPEHILSHPLRLAFCAGPDAAMDIKAGVTPGEEALLPTVGTADAGKSATGITAVEASLRGTQ